MNISQRAKIEKDKSFMKTWSTPSLQELEEGDVTPQFAISYLLKYK